MVRSRAARIAVGGVAALTLAAAGTAAVLVDEPRDPPLPVTRAAVPDRGPLLPAASGAPVPTSAGLAAALRQALRHPALGSRVALSVRDAETARPLLELGAAVPLVPASTAKLATAVAALAVLEPDGRLRTRVVRGPRAGEVVLVGGGDPTLAGPRARQRGVRVAQLEDLARQVRSQLGAEAVTRVTVDDALYTGPRTGPGWRPGYVTDGDVAPVTALAVDAGRVRPDRRERVADPALAAGGALAALLQPRGGVAVARGRAAPTAAELGAVSSPPFGRLVELMLARSDNDLAEALARHVALTRGEPASFSGAARAVSRVLMGRGARGIVLVDGSGLSRLNRVQPTSLTRLLADAVGQRSARFAPLLTGLPVAGFDGTLSERFRSGAPRAAAGVVRAKTGTLSGVSALAGLVRTRDGRLLAFDVTADAVPSGLNGPAEDALDRLAGALASCGCR